MPSSSSSTPNPPPSIACATSAAVPAGSRSAIASASIPSVSSTPASRRVIPADKVAARSIPPTRRSTDTLAGTLRTGPANRASPASQPSRAGPDRARNATPPTPAASSAKIAAAIPASLMPASLISVAVKLETAPPPPAPPGCPSPPRPADPAAACAGSAIGATSSMSPRVTASRPASAATARAARNTVNSARNPSVPSAMHSRAASSSTSSPASTPANTPRAATISDCSPASASAHRSRNPAPSRSNASRRFTISTRLGTSRGVATSTASPNRSSSCGRNSPSSGFPLPTSTNRAGCRTESPSPLDHVLPRGRHVDQQVDQVVLQQVHLVDIQKAPVRPRQQPRLERPLPPRQRPLQIQRANHPVLRRPQRQIDHRNGHHLRPNHPFAPGA